MSNYWDLYCATCKKAGGVVHWNRGDEPLAKLVLHLPTIALLKSVGGELTLRFDSGPDWQGSLIDFAVEHAGHVVLVRSEYGYCKDCEDGDYVEAKDTGEYISKRRDACDHVRKELVPVYDPEDLVEED
jgi:hypothetical protein